MKNEIENMSPRSAIRERLQENREEVSAALQFYLRTEKNLSKAERAKISNLYACMPNLSELLPNETDMTPSKILLLVLEAIEEYLRVLDSFTEDQFAAFVLGMGLWWIPLPFWGLQASRDQKAKVAKAMKEWQGMEEVFKDSEKGHLEKPLLFSPVVDLVPPQKAMPTKILSIYAELLNAQIAVLENSDMIKGSEDLK